MVPRWLCLLLVLGLGATAQADQVNANGLWISAQSILGIRDGKLIYANQWGDQVSTKLDQVQALRIDQIPKIEQAYEQMDAENYERAAGLWQDALRQAQRQGKWLEHIVRYKMLECYDRTGDFRRAVQQYFRLVQDRTRARRGEDRTDIFFLKRPPLASMENAKESDRKEYIGRLEPLIPKLEGDPQALLRKLVRRLGQGIVEQPPDPDPDTSGSSGADDGPDFAAPLPPRESEDPELVLPKQIDNDEVTNHLLRNQYAQAEAKATEWLTTTTRSMALRLYQRGLARMGLARQNDHDPQTYKAAGLDFVRLSVWRPKSLYLAPAVMELIEVHRQLGMMEQVRLLMSPEQFDSTLTIGIDEDDDPKLYERWQRIQERIAQDMQQRR
jgi:hypothetical protein